LAVEVPVGACNELEVAGAFFVCANGDESFFLNGAQEHSLIINTDVELNPVKAGLVKKAWDYRWSSVHAHLAGEDSRGIILPEKLLSLAGDWRTYLQESQGSSGIEFEQHGRTGRPLGSERFIEKAGRLLQRDLKKKKPGPKSDGDNK